MPVLVDIDGDGDRDLLLGNKIEQDDPLNGALYRFVNEGTPAAPRFRMAGEVDMGTGYHYVPAFGDLDGDGDLDAIVGTWADEIRYYENVAEDGSIRLQMTDSAYLTLTRGRNATPALGDLDADGDLDLFVGETSGTLNYYENVGGPLSPEFSLVSDEYGDLDVGRRSVPVLYDIDRDGDLDLVVGSESDGLQLIRNLGTATTPDFAEPEPFGVDDFGFSAPALGDIDGDGTDELLLGGSWGGLWLFDQRR